jgi:hypothetical protein
MRQVSHLSCFFVVAGSAANQIAHVNCGGCGITLMYTPGCASSLLLRGTHARHGACVVCL